MRVQGEVRQDKGKDMIYDKRQTKLTKGREVFRLRRLCEV